MRYFDKKLVANSKLHADWWNQVCGQRQWFHQTENELAKAMNSAAILPRDAWQDLDGITRRVMRNDEGQAFMADLMPLAKPVHIGKLVHLNRVSSDAGAVTRSLSGQVPTNMDKVTYDYRGTPVPIFSTAYGREWREWNTHQSENFDAISDDQEAHTAKIRRDMALYALDGDEDISVKGYSGTGIRTNPLSQSINLGTATGGASIDLTSSNSDDTEAFVNNVLGAALDDNFIGQGVNMYVSPEIGRNLDKPYSGSSGFKVGSLRDALVANRRINKIEVTFELEGNEFFAFVPNSEYIRPLIGMAVNTTAMTRLNPTDNYQFLILGAMGLEIRADFNGRTGVFYSVVEN